MTLDELRALDFRELWFALPAHRQAAIGEAALASEFALLVGEDDGSETTHDERLVAHDIASAAFNDLPRAIQAAFPQVVWFDPEPSEPHLDHYYGDDHADAA